MRTLALRASCSADNAFSTASAIRTAFAAQTSGREAARPLYSTDRTRPRRPALSQIRCATSLSQLSKTIDKFDGREAGASRQSTPRRGRDLRELQRDLRNSVQDGQGSHAKGVDSTSTQYSRTSHQSIESETLDEQPLAAERNDPPFRGKFPDSASLTESFPGRGHNGAELQKSIRRVVSKDAQTRSDESEAMHLAQPGKKALEPALDWHPNDLETWPRAMQRIGADVAKLSQLPPSKELVEERRQKCDYLGLYIPPREGPQKQQGPSPWELGLDQINGLSAEDMLQEEIALFMKYWELTPHEARARGSVIRDVRNSMNNILQDVGYCPISGSQNTGLAMATSDIDLKLHSRQNGHPQQRARIRSDFVKLFDYMTNHKNWMLVTLRMANFPLINAQHVKTGIPVQIVSSPSTIPQEIYTRESISQVPNLRTLYMLLHTTLSMRRLVDVFNGGIGSYGLFCMIAAAVNRQPNGANASLVDQLMHFLDFYSDFDPVKHGISVQSGRLFKKHNIDDFNQSRKFIKAAARRGDDVRAGQWAIGKRRLYQPYLFCLQDPVTPSNDLGRKTNAAKHLFVTIRRLRDDLRKNLELGAEVYNAKPPGERSLLAPLLGRCHEVYADQRQKLQDYEVNKPERRVFRKFNDNTPGAEGSMQQSTAEQADTGLEDHEHVNAGTNTSGSSESSGAMDKPHVSNVADNEQPGSRGDVAADGHIVGTEVKSNENIGA